MTLAIRTSAEPLGYQRITDLSASTALTVPTHARRAIIQCEGQSVRWRDDGQAPTASVGMLLEAGGELEYDGTVSALRLIETAASATLNVSYYY